MSDDTKTQATETAPAQEPQNNGVELTVSDLNNLKQIIDVASSRGAFKPNEMTAVGTVYTKLENFLQAVAAQQQSTSNQNA